MEITKDFDPVYNTHKHHTTEGMNLTPSARGYRLSPIDGDRKIMTVSLTIVGDLGKPATVLVEKISDALGGYFKPYQMVRIANAEAEVALIQTETQIQVNDLQRRAMQRFLDEEAKKQLNIEGITQKALPLLKEESSPQNVENDWITNFFDKCRIISDEDMQRLWSSVLAGEANTPSTFSKRTVNLLADLDKSDALLFTHLCGFGWRIGREICPLVFNNNDKVYHRHNINFDSLNHLESLGLLQFEPINYFKKLKIPMSLNVLYYGKVLKLTFPQEADNELEVGQVLLTKAGQELALVCGSSPVEGFFDYVYDKWANQSYVPKRTTESNAPTNS